MSEPEIALAFTAELWVERVHRHFADHGGARVRTLVVEPEVALAEEYDVLVAGHRWPSLTRALVEDVHARGRSVVGVCDTEEPPSRTHLRDIGVDAILESDAPVDAFLRAIAEAARATPVPIAVSPAEAPRRSGRLVVVGGAPGTGRTEVAVALASALARRADVVLVDADDVAPAVAQRLHLPIEPNLRTAIEAVEHGRGDVEACVVRGPGSPPAMGVLVGVPNANAWAQVRPAEVIRVVDALASGGATVVVDGVGALDDLVVHGRGRYATARALLRDADEIVAVCDASPQGLARLLAWCVDACAVAPEVLPLVVVNRAPRSRFRRAELREELVRSIPLRAVHFVEHDARVADCAWDGVCVRRAELVRMAEAIAR